MSYMFLHTLHSILDPAHVHSLHGKGKKTGKSVDSATKAVLVSAQAESSKKVEHGKSPLQQLTVLGLTNATLSKQSFHSLKVSGHCLECTCC
jgi:hypothetical protein